MDALRGELDPSDEGDNLKGLDEVEVILREWAGGPIEYTPGNSALIPGQYVRISSSIHIVRPLVQVSRRSFSCTQGDWS